MNVFFLYREGGKRLSEVFNHVKHYMRLYRQYMENYNKSTKAIDELRKTCPTFDIIVKEIEVRDCL